MVVHSSTRFAGQNPTYEVLETFLKVYLVRSDTSLLETSTSGLDERYRTTNVNDDPHFNFVAYHEGLTIVGTVLGCFPNTQCGLDDVRMRHNRGILGRPWVSGPVTLSDSRGRRAVLYTNLR